MVKRYKESDFTQCVNLFVEVYNSPPWNDQWTAETAGSHLRELINNPRPAGFVLWKEGRVLGAAFCYEKTWWSGDELYIDEFYVSIHHKRQGLGTELMRSIEQYAAENSLSDLTLITDKGMPAFEFYKKNGLICKNQNVFMYKENL